MQHHIKGVRFSPYDTYERRYNEYFYNNFSNKISGDVLDLAAGSHTPEKYNNKNVNLYLSIDIKDNESLSVIGDANYLPFRNHCFDTVIVSELYEHLPIDSIPAVTSEIYRILKPDGVVLLSTPFIYPIHADVERVRLTDQALKNIFTNAGFKKTEIYRGGGYTEVLLSVIYRPFVFTIFPYLNISILGWLFAVIHYPLLFIAFIINSLIVNIIGKNPTSTRWYIMTFTTAEK